MIFDSDRNEVDRYLQAVDEIQRSLSSATITSNDESLFLVMGNYWLVGDIARKKDVEKVVRGSDCVFHLASYGMSGKEMLHL
ncbi:hypothetical protein ACB092_04G018300 [Castanea dentata]